MGDHGPFDPPPLRVTSAFPRVGDVRLYPRPLVRFQVARERREILASGLDPSRRSAAFARLRRVVADLRSGLLSATVALNLMNVISESVERAIMFLVRDRRLVALGAFGYSMSGVPLARLTSSLEMSFDSPNALSEAIDDGQTRSLSFDDAGLPDHFAELVGRPRTGQVVVFPVPAPAMISRLKPYLMASCHL